MPAPSLTDVVSRPLYDERGNKIPVLFNIAEMKRITMERLALQKLRNGRTLREREESNLKAKAKAARSTARTVIKEVSIPFEGCTLRELSSRMSIKLQDVKSKLLELGETVDSLSPSDAPVRVKGKQKRGMKARLVAEKGTEGDSFIEADVAELVVLEMGLQPKR
jgi:hypothetical protein